MLDLNGLRENKKFDIEFTKFQDDKTINSAGDCELNPRSVLRGLNSQVDNCVGVHWLRVSIPRQYIERLKKYLKTFFDDPVQDGYGLWSYDSRYLYQNGASLNFDAENARADEIHHGKCTLDCPGGSLDVLADDDLHLFVQGLRAFGTIDESGQYCPPNCTRLDAFFDDFERSISPHELIPVLQKRDFTGFRSDPGIRLNFAKGGGFSRDEVTFGNRGAFGCGKYLRIYDKFLESEGERNCIRWEVEFSKERAKEVFNRLSQTETLEQFATLCGAVVCGSIDFIHRTGDKNISRAKRYDFWDRIVKRLGRLTVRVKQEKSTYESKVKWVKKQVSPTLGCLKGVFVDQYDFMNWLLDIVLEGEANMNAHHREIVRQNKRKNRYVSRYEQENAKEFELV